MQLGNLEPVFRAAGEVYGRDFPNDCLESSVSLCKNSSHRFALPHISLATLWVKVPCGYSLSSVTLFLPSVFLGSQVDRGAWAGEPDHSRGYIIISKNNVRYPHSDISQWL